MSVDATKSLPSGWDRATIGELVGPDGVFIDGDWVESKDQDPDGDVRLIQLADVGDGTYQDRSSRFLTSKKAVELRCTFLERGDVLIARMPDPLGRACIFPGDSKRAVTVVDVCIVRTGSGGANHRWLTWAINSPDFRSAVAGLQSGSTRKRISRGNLATLLLPISPLAEQTRIADEIEKQFTRLDAAVAALKRVQGNLKRYRATVLKAACEGRLVPTEAELARREGRSYEPASVLLERILAERRSCWHGTPTKYVSPNRPNSIAMSRLPEGWATVTVEQVSFLVQYGSSAKTSDDPEGIPVLRMGNLNIDGRLELEQLKYLPEDHDEFPDLLLDDGDLLFNRTNSAELVGKSAVYRGNPTPCSLASYLIRVKTISGCDSRYLALCLNSSLGRAWIKSVVSQQVGQANVNGTKLQAFVFPLPPEAEQHRILAEVDRKLSVVEEQELVIGQNLLRAERLRQSILKLSFEGKLVPQNPQDEPARVLLERIRADRNAGHKGSPIPLRGKRNKEATHVS